MLLERRQYERYQLPLPVLVQFHGTEPRGAERTQLRDIAIGGAALPLSTPVEIGSELDLNLLDTNNHLARALGLEAPEHGPLRFSVNGRVVRRDRSPVQTEPDRFAVEFLSPLRISMNAGIF